MNNEIQLKWSNKSQLITTEKTIFFIHGWGSDGNDLIQISHLWEKNT